MKKLLSFLLVMSIMSGCASLLLVNASGEALVAAVTQEAVEETDVYTAPKTEKVVKAEVPATQAVSEEDQPDDLVFFGMINVYDLIKPVFRAFSEMLKNFFYSLSENAFEKIELITGLNNIKTADDLEKAAQSGMSWTVKNDIEAASALAFEKRTRLFSSDKTVSSDFTDSALFTSTSELTLKGLKLSCAGDCVVSSGTKLSVSGGEYSSRGGKAFVLKKSGLNATLNTNAVTSGAKADTIENSAVCTINGGSYTAQGGNAAVLRAKTGSKTTIKDGTFTNPTGYDIIVEADASVEFKGGNAGDVYVAKGGKFTQSGGKTVTVTYEDEDDKPLERISGTVTTDMIDRVLEKYSYYDNYYWMGNNAYYASSYPQGSCYTFDNTSQCLAFASYVMYQTTGEMTRARGDVAYDNGGWKVYTDISGIDSLKVGDIIRQGSHSAVVYTVDENGNATFIEVWGSQNNKIKVGGPFNGRYGNPDSIEDFRRTGIKYLYRYEPVA